MMLVGLSGYAQSGKDTLGRMLVEDYGFHRYAFADLLRSVLAALNPIVVPASYGYSEMDLRVQDLVKLGGWERAKLENSEIRELLQRLGTDAGRNLLGDNVWVDAAFNQITKDAVGRVVITDVRFPNEAKRIKEEGGVVIRVKRPGTAPVNPHVSETALDEWGFDYTIPNDGTIAALQGSAKVLVGELQNPHANRPSIRLPGYGSPTLRG